MDEDRIIAWIDGELDPAEAAEVARAVAADPQLAARAEAHRKLKARLAAAFGPLMRERVAMPQLPRPEAEVVSLAAARKARELRHAPPAQPRRWMVPGAIAASLLVGLVGGTQLQVAGISDDTKALALAAPIGRALDGQLSGEAGPIRVALSFRNQDGAFCRSFTGTHLGGIACRDAGGWQLRYAAPAAPLQGDYRMAGSDVGTAAAVQSMIVGAPLDALQERQARNTGWR